MRITFVTATGRTVVDHFGNDQEDISKKVNEYTTMIRQNGYLVIHNGDEKVTMVNPHAINEIIGEPDVPSSTS